MLLGTAETRPNKIIDWMEHRSVPSTIRSRTQLQPSPPLYSRNPGAAELCSLIKWLASTPVLSHGKILQRLTADTPQESRRFLLSIAKGATPCRY